MYALPFVFSDPFFIQDYLKQLEYALKQLNRIIFNFGEFIYLLHFM